MKKNFSNFAKGFASWLGMAVLGMVSFTATAADYLPAPATTPANGKAAEMTGYLYLDWQFDDVEFDVEGLEHSVGSFKNIDRVDEDGTPWLSLKVEGVDYTEDWATQTNWWFGGSSIRLQYVQSEDKTTSLARVQISLGDMVPFFLSGEFNVTVKEGLVKSVDGRVSPETSFTFYVMEALGDAVYTPESGKVYTAEEMADGIQVKVKWSADVESVNANAEFKPFIQAGSSTGDVSGQIVLTDYKAEDGYLVLNIPPVGGTYSLTIPEGSVFLRNGDTRYINKEEPGLFTFSTPKAELPEYKVTPEAGTVNGLLNSFSVVWGDNCELEVIGEPVVRVLDSTVEDDGVMPGLPGVLTTDNGTLTYTLDAPLSEGTYNVQILASSLYVKVDGVNVPNDEVAFTYTIEAPTVELPAPVAKTNADTFGGSFFDSIDVIWWQVEDEVPYTLELNYPAEELKNLVKFTKDGRPLEIAGVILTEFQASEDSQNYDNARLVASLYDFEWNLAGTNPVYEIEIPAGVVSVIVDGQKVPNQEITVSLTLEAPKQWYEGTITMTPEGSVNVNGVAPVVNELNDIVVNFSNLDVALNSGLEADMFILDGPGVQRQVLTAGEYKVGDDSKSLEFHIGEYVKENGEYSLSITGESVILNGYYSTDYDAYNGEFYIKDTFLYFNYEAPAEPVDFTDYTVVPESGSYIDVIDEIVFTWEGHKVEILDASLIVLTHPNTYEQLTTESGHLTVTAEGSSLIIKVNDPVYNMSAYEAWPSLYINPGAFSLDGQSFVIMGTWGEEGMGVGYNMNPNVPKLPEVDSDPIAGTWKAEKTISEVTLSWEGFKVGADAGNNRLSLLEDDFELWEGPDNNRYYPGAEGFTKSSITIASVTGVGANDGEFYEAVKITFSEPLADSSKGYTLYLPAYNFLYLTEDGISVYQTDELALLYTVAGADGMVIKPATYQNVNYADFKGLVVEGGNAALQNASGIELYKGWGVTASNKGNEDHPLISVGSDNGSEVGNVVVAFNDNPIYDGTYTIVIPAGAITGVSARNIEFSISGHQQGIETIEVVTDPADGDTVPFIHTVWVSWGEYLPLSNEPNHDYFVAEGEEETFEPVEITGATMQYEGGEAKPVTFTLNRRETPDDSDDGGGIAGAYDYYLEYVAEDAYVKEGNYTFNIPAGVVYVLISSGNDQANEAYSFTVTVEEPYLDPYIHVDMDHENQTGGIWNELLRISTEEEGQQGKIVIDAPEGFEVWYKVEPKTNYSLYSLEDEGYSLAENHTIMLDEGEGNIDIKAVHPVSGVETNTLSYSYVVGKDVSTGIAGVAADADGLYRVYNLNGVNVLTTDDAAELFRLEKGIYIINGKKAVVRP